MLSIDEAIKHERKLSDCCKKMFDYMNEANKISNTLLKNEIEEHEQLAKWLEELEAYREIGTVKGYKSAIECYTEEYTRRKSNEQYNKAIDDFAKALTTMYEKYDIDDVFESSDTYSYTSACYIFERYIYEIAERLKEGGKE